MIRLRFSSILSSGCLLCCDEEDDKDEPFSRENDVIYLQLSVSYIRQSPAEQ